MAGFDTALLGKDPKTLTPQELASLSSYLSEVQNSVLARQTELKKTLETEQFGKIAVVSKEAMLAMSWAKLPKLIILPNADGTEYTVEYVKSESKRKAAGESKRAAPDVNSGDITVNKIATAMGGIAMFEAGGKQFEGIKELVKELKQPGADGKPGTVSEAERCWDISKKGISASDIVTNYHADEVKLIFNDKSELTVAQAVEKMKAARTAAAAAAQA